MTKAETVRSLMKKDSWLDSEVTHVLEIDHEDGQRYDEAEAFDYFIDLWYDNPDTTRKEMVAMNKALIATGDMVPVDITNIYVSSGKRYSFKLAGVHYDWKMAVDSPEGPTAKGITFITK